MAGSAQCASTMFSGHPFATRCNRALVALALMSSLRLASHRRLLDGPLRLHKLYACKGAAHCADCAVDAGLHLLLTPAPRCFPLHIGWFNYLSVLYVFMRELLSPGIHVPFIVVIYFISVKYRFQKHKIQDKFILLSHCTPCSPCHTCSMVEPLAAGGLLL